MRTEASFDSTVSPGDAKGSVVDAYSGEPIYGAEISSITVDARPGPSALADSTGHFRLTGLASAPMVIRARRLGHRPDSIIVHAEKGIAVQLALRWAC